MSYLQVVLEENLKQKKLLGTYGILQEEVISFSPVQEQIFSTFEDELWPLLEELQSLYEEDLTPEEIEDIFSKAEKLSQGKKSFLSKAKEIAKKGKDSVKTGAKISGKVLKKVNDKVNELGEKLQETEPVKNLDSAFDKVIEKIKNKLGEKHKVIKLVEKYGEWAKKHPMKSSFALAVLTAGAAFAGGPMGGAVVGHLLRASNNLVKGDKFSTAMGKGAKGAALGALAGMAFEFIGDNVLAVIEDMGSEEIQEFKKSLQQVNMDEYIDQVKDSMPEGFDITQEYRHVVLRGNVNSFYYNYDVVFEDGSAEAKQFNELTKSINRTESFSKEFYKETAKFHDFMSKLQRSEEQSIFRQGYKILEKISEIKKNGPDSLSLPPEQMDEVIKKYGSLEELVNKVGNKFDIFGASLQAGTQEAEELKKGVIKIKNGGKKEKTKGPLDEWVKKKSYVDMINENITLKEEKFTKKDFNDAWEKAGKPKDRKTILKIIKDIGGEKLSSEVEEMQFKKDKENTKAKVDDTKKDNDNGKKSELVKVKKGELDTKTKAVGPRRKKDDEEVKDADFRVVGDDEGLVKAKKGEVGPRRKKQDDEEIIDVDAKVIDDEPKKKNSSIDDGKEDEKEEGDNKSKESNIGKQLYTKVDFIRKDLKKGFEEYQKKTEIEPGMDMISAGAYFLNKANKGRLKAKELYKRSVLAAKEKNFKVLEVQIRDEIKKNREEFDILVNNFEQFLKSKEEYIKSNSKHFDPDVKVKTVEMLMFIRDRIVKLKDDRVLNIKTLDAKKHINTKKHSKILTAISQDKKLSLKNKDLYYANKEDDEKIDSLINLLLTGNEKVSSNIKKLDDKKYAKYLLKALEEFRKKPKDYAINDKELNDLDASVKKEIEEFDEWYKDQGGEKGEKQKKNTSIEKSTDKNKELPQGKKNKELPQGKKNKELGTGKQLKGLPKGDEKNLPSKKEESYKLDEKDESDIANRLFKKIEKNS